MPFISRLRVETALASGQQALDVEPQIVSQTELTLHYHEAPEVIERKNLYFDRTVPKFDAALYIQGSSVESSGIRNGDTVLIQKFSQGNVAVKGDVVVLNAAKLYGQDYFHMDWKCLRIVEESPSGGYVKASATTGGEIDQKTVPESDILGKAIYVF